ncbi:MAG: 2-C-methyl-D-erythritol 4-phosphate cytidylyltransferase [Gammaproteobacteria bacterium]
MSESGARCWAVVPAGGKGARMGADVPKQYLELGGRPIIEHTLARLANHPRIAGVVVAVAADDALWPIVQSALPPHRVAPGGRERCHSVLNALDTLVADADVRDWVLVHDAARPCLHPHDLTRLIDAAIAGTATGCILGTAVRDTLKRCDSSGVIEDTVDRTHLWHALTPQMFRLGELRQALAGAVADGRIVTDEAQAIELAGGTVRVVEGRADNLKITRPEDLVLAGLFLAAQTKEGR